MGDLCRYHLVDIVLLLLYTGTFMVTLATSCWDERLAFHHFSPSVAWINTTVSYLEVYIILNSFQEIICCNEFALVTIIW